MDKLFLRLSTATLSSLKQNLTDSMRGIKSSHRCEALGRGLGFRTYAAARHAAMTGLDGIVRPNGTRFVEYLDEKGIAARRKDFFDAVASAALGDVVERNPLLSAYGIGVGHPRRKPDGRYESAEEQYEKFQEGRRELASSRSVPGFLASTALLSRINETKTIREGTGSYWLKHIAENYECSYPDNEKLGPTYIPNGVFIAAAINSGFRIKTYIDEDGSYNLNVSFNMSVKCLRELDQEIRGRTR
ncbi:MAG: hypothetical protein AAGE18_04435 [Pseudomonadota bacterium]